jgi:hypothetical protein
VIVTNHGWPQAPSAGAKRRSPDRDETPSGTTAAPAAPEALLQRLSLAAPDPAQRADSEYCPPAVPSERRPPDGASDKTEPGGGACAAVEGNATEGGASWRLPLAATDAPFTAQEARPLERCAEGAAVREAPVQLSPLKHKCSAVMVRTLATVFDNDG